MAHDRFLTFVLHLVDLWIANAIVVTYAELNC